MGIGKYKQKSRDRVDSFHDVKTLGILYLLGRRGRAPYAYVHVFLAAAFASSHQRPYKQPWIRIKAGRRVFALRLFLRLLILTRNPESGKVRHSSPHIQATMERNGSLAPTPQLNLS